MRVRRWFYRVLPGRARPCLLLTALLLGFAWGVGWAQDQAPAAGVPYTFHVYEDLIQVPALVTDRAQNSYGHLDPADFSVQLDSGPTFHPRHSRTQGDESLHVAVLLMGKPHDLAAYGDQVLAALPSNWLSAQDFISVYAVDCNLVRSVNHQPFARETVLDGVTRALGAHDLHLPRAEGLPCNGNGHLWDELATVVTIMGQQPGWRVIMPVTSGLDKGSHVTWKTVQQYAGAYGVSFVGLRTPRSPAAGESRWRTGSSEDSFDLLCNGTGGLALPVVPTNFIWQLSHAVRLLRSRYILAFARPTNGTVGLHDISITVPKSAAVVSIGGVSFPVQDKTLLAQPNTLLSDPSRAPTVGDRHILTQPH